MDVCLLFVSDLFLRSFSTLVAIDPTNGAALYTTPTMAGVTKGTPLCTEDGSIVLATHNEDAEKGHFSVFNYGASTVNYTLAARSTGNSSYPFSAVGYYYSPIEGNYPEGAGNPNDLFMWVADVPGSATEAGNGQMFAFQLPVVLPFNSTPISAYPVGNQTTFQSPNPPVFAGQGYIMYQANTKSEMRYWQGDGLPRNFFAATANENIGFSRGLPRFAAPGAPPTLSSNPLTPNVYGPTASNEIFMMPYDFSTSMITNISSPLTNKVLISPDDLYLYYGTKDASLVQLDATTLQIKWNVTTLGPVQGEMAQSRDGVYVYVADSAGWLTAFQVKEKSTVESVFPSATPNYLQTGVPIKLLLSDVPTPELSGTESFLPTLVGSESSLLPTPPPIGNIPTAPSPAASPMSSPVATPNAVSAASPLLETSIIGILFVVALLANVE
jgi:hypothetical protein